jgi:hypothetical protein
MDPRHKGRQTVYRIRVEGQLDQSWSGWFSGMTVSFQDGVSTMTGPITDQSALRGLLSKIWDLNLTLISVVRLGSRENS